MGKPKIQDFRIHVQSIFQFSKSNQTRKLSAQRLYKVKTGATLVNALDEQGESVKQQFFKTRRKTES